MGVTINGNRVSFHINGNIKKLDCGDNVITL